MAKFWSSIRDSDIQDIEKNVKSYFVLMGKGNTQMCRQITDHTRLYIRYDKLKFKVNSTFNPDDEKLTKMIEELNKLEAKWDAMQKTYDGRYIRLIMQFSIFITSNGLFKLTNVLNFGLWLQTPSEETDYYVYRR